MAVRGGAGVIGGSAATSGNPGAGSSNSITGTATTYAVGGSALLSYAYTGLVAGVDNPSIGGGGRSNAAGGASNGNAGVVIVRYATPPATPIFTSSTAPATGSVGTAYAGYTFAASGPPSPTFAVATGALPAGLTLNTSTGALSGTPTSAGTATFTVSATNTSGTVSTGTQTIVVSPAAAAPVFTAASPPGGTAGSGYGGYTFTASGYPAPTFAVTVGFLPLGLSLSSAGVLSGTPSVAGTSTFTVAASNASGTVTTSVTIVVAATPSAPTFVFASPSSTGVVGTAYSSYTFSALAVPTPTFSVSSGALPAGLVLSSAGVLSGTPTTAGSSSFTVRANNSAGTVDTSSLTITVSPAAAGPAFVNQSPPTSVLVGSAYAGYTFTATGYPAPVFTVSSGALPLGLALDAVTGALSGTPLAAGVSTFAVAATNLTSSVVSSSVTITVTSVPVFVFASPSSTGVVGTAYSSYTFSALAVPTPTFSVSSGALPAGLVLSSAGVLSGTPTTAGSSSFTVRATNSAGTADTSSLTITVSPAAAAPAFVNQSPPASVLLGAAYAGYTFTATGYPAPVFTVSSGALPLGLALNAVTGALSGTPLAAGVSTFTVAAANLTSSVVSSSTTITVTSVPVFVLASPSSTGVVGTAYSSYTFSALAVPAPTFSVITGTLPAGLVLSSAGVLSGTPTTAGSSSFTVRATNSAGAVDTGSLTITVSPAAAAPGLVNQSPPASVLVGAAYAGYTFTATGYPAPIFTVSSGALPLGLVLNALTGALSGTPLAAGASTFTVAATNLTSSVVSGSITITVTSVPVFLFASPPTTGAVGTAYGPYTFSALAVPAPTFSVSTGVLPAGLVLSSAGVLSGTPTAVGPASFTVRAGNSAGTVDTSSITITTSPAPVAPGFVNQSPPTTGTVGTAYPGYTFTATGYPAPVFAVASGTLPLGLALDPLTGVLSGTPLLAGSSTITVSAGSLSGTVATSAITLVIAPLPVPPVFLLASPPSTGTVGTVYAPYTFTALGVPAPTFTLASGALPTGLTLTSAGVLAGNPSAAGSFTFAVTAGNSAGSATSGSTTITVAPTPVAPVFTAAAPPATGMVGSGYAGYTFAATGVPAPTFAVTGLLPLGLSLTSAGVLSGTPIVVGSSTFTVSATNSAGTATTSSLTIVVAPATVTPFFLLAAPPATGTVGTAYAGYAYTAFGVPTPTFSLATGTLPTGLTLTSAGVLAGTPSAAGTFTFTVTTTNSAGSATAGSQTITVAPAPVAPVFTAASPPLTGTFGTAYAGYTFAASGVPAATFTVDTGFLPFGLSLSSAGVLSGTPLAVGSSTFTVAATNSAGTVSTSSETIVVSPIPIPPTFLLVLPPSTGTVGTAYAGYTFTALGVPAPTFALGSGTLPDGLTLSSAGVLAGTPTTAGSSTFTVTAGSSAGTVTSSAQTIVVAPTPVAPVFTAATPPATGTELTGYAGYTFAASGVPAPTFAVDGGSLPLGLTLSSAGALSGTPVLAGVSTFTVAATNSAGAVSTSSRTITVSPVALAPAFLAQLPPLTATVGTAYPGYTFTALGYPAATFTVGSGTLPAGLTLSSAGLLAGTPTGAGTATFTVTATNSAGTASTLPLALVVSPAAAAPALVSQSPPATGTVTSAYSYTFTATGYPAPTFALASGSLPAGLTLIGGVLSGVPILPGTSTFTVSATNAGGAVSSGSKTIVVSPAAVAPLFTSLPPLPATEGMPYTQTFTTVGYPAATYSSTDPLPTGLTLTSAGVLAGTPAAATAGSYPITVTAANGTAPAAGQTFTLVVAPAPTVPVPPLFIGALPATATVGTAYSSTFTATGFPAPTFGTTGPLPSGITLTSTGVLAGTPASGSDRSYTFLVTATNGTAPDATRSVTLLVVAAPLAPTISSGTPAGATVGAAYSQTFTATGVPAGMTFSTGDPLPLGLTLTPVGLLAGVPAPGTAGSYPVVVTASNGTAPDATDSFTLTVAAAPAAPGFTDADPSTARVGTAFSHAFTATGVPAVPSFTTGDPLPSGLTLTAAGVLAGVPLPGSAGDYPITVTAANGVSPNATRTLTLTVLPALAAPVFTDAAPAAATALAVYLHTFTASGFPTPTFSTSDALPVGLSLTSAGVLAGLPSAGSVGSHTLTVTASNGVSPDVSRSVTLVVAPAQVPPVFVTVTPPAGAVGVPYAGYLFTAHRLSAADLHRRLESACRTAAFQCGRAVRHTDHGREPGVSADRLERGRAGPQPAGAPRDRYRAGLHRAHPDADRDQRRRLQLRFRGRRPAGAGVRHPGPATERLEPGPDQRNAHRGQPDGRVVHLQRDRHQYVRHRDGRAVHHHGGGGAGRPDVHRRRATVGRRAGRSALSGVPFHRDR